LLCIDFEPRQLRESRNHAGEIAARISGRRKAGAMMIKKTMNRSLHGATPQSSSDSKSDDPISINIHK